MNTTLFRIVGIWTLFVIVAVLNAAIREHVFTPIIGQQLALPLSGILLSIFIFFITLGMVPFLKVSNMSGFWLVGVFWVLLTVTFEFVFGYYIIGESWDTLFKIFNILEGDLFVLVLLVTAVSPYITAKIRILV